MEKCHLFFLSEAKIPPSFGNGHPEGSQGRAPLLQDSSEPQETVKHLEQEKCPVHRGGLRISAGTKQLHEKLPVFSHVFKLSPSFGRSEFTSAANLVFTSHLGL